MALEGSIGDFGLAEIFQLILLQKKEGILVLTDGKKQISVHFREGEIIQSESKELSVDEALGNAFLHKGAITIDQMKEGLRRRNHRSLGQALVELGYLSVDQVRDQNRILTEEGIFQLFEWKMGNYKFEQKNISYDSDLVMPLKTEFILMEGMQRLDEWPALLRKIPSRETVFEIVPDERPAAVSSVAAEKSGPEDSFESMGTLSAEGEPDERASSLLTSVDGKQTVQGLIDQTQIGAFPVYKELAAFLSAGKIKVKEGTAQKKSQLISVKKLTSMQTSLRTLIIGITIAAVALIWISSYQATRSVLLSARDATLELKKLQVWNEKDILLNALELYHLNHHEYPPNLRRLVEERLLVSPRERAVDLKKWSYQMEGDVVNLQPL